MKTMTIPLTQGKMALVDAEDYEYLMQWKWQYCKGAYARRSSPRPKRKSILMHRVILERMGFQDFKNSDRINRDRLDNRRCNLRPATYHQSQCNRNKQSNNTSGYTGVCWNRQYKKWQVRIKASDKRRHFGYFTDKKEAARVYNLAARMYHGEFAVLNKV